jgi:hypothetical protein
MMHSYRIRYRCVRCINAAARYTWRCRAKSKRQASAKFYDTPLRAWKIVSITEVA